MRGDIWSEEVGTKGCVGAEVGPVGGCRGRGGASSGCVRAEVGPLVV